MTRMEALAIARLWHAWSAERSIDNRARREFVFQVVAVQSRLRHLNCFDVLDAITNEAAWLQLGQVRSAATRVPTRSAPEHGTGRQPAAPRVVEVEEATY